MVTPAGVFHSNGEFLGYLAEFRRNSAGISAPGGKMSGNFASKTQAAPPFWPYYPYEEETYILRRMAQEMSEIVEILESELQDAFEVKNPKSLHRYVVLMVDRFASKSVAEQQNQRFDEILSSMREGFGRMDQRFEDMQRQMDTRFQAVDRRFEAADQRFEDMQRQMDTRFQAVDRRFTMLVTLMSVFFTLLAGMITAFGVLT